MTRLRQLVAAPFSTSARASFASRYPPTVAWQRGRAGGSRGGGPFESWRRTIDNIPHQYILYGLIATNLAVYLAWQYAFSVYERFRDPSMYRFMQNNFTTSWNNFTSLRVWTLLTSTCSHERSGHILLNLMSLFFMAPPVLAMLGNTGFLALYTFSGVAASAFSLLFNHFLAPKSPRNAQYSSHGASGAVYGTISFFAAAYPRTTFLIFFVIPCPAWLCVSGLFAYDLYSSFRTSTGGTDSAGHVGGVVAGLYWFFKKGLRFG